MPPASLPEIAFIGRSNVGKSSLINMLCGRKDLAKTSGKPGKTQSINRFLINESWFLTDLPGYGYAQVSKTQRSSFGKMIEDYFLQQKALDAVCILIDSRIPPQRIDLEFIHWCGQNDIPFLLVFTKAEKLKKAEMTAVFENYKAALFSVGFEDVPEMFLTSATTGLGKEEFLDFVKKEILEG